jgi:two-component system, OmpR family, response regulator
MSNKEEAMRVLIVDDDNDVRRIAKLSLTWLGGIEVHEAENGFHCLETVAGIQPDLILLDVTMPGMDGPSTLRALRKEPETAHIPVVFVTGRTHRSETDSLSQLGAAGVVAKPFDPRRLTEEILCLLPGATVH